VTLPAALPPSALPLLDSAESDPKTRDLKPDTRVQPKQGATRPSDSITAELSQIEAARSALRGGDPGRSLRLLSEYTQQYPKGNLRTEATVLRIEALSASGDHTAASRLGKQFLAQSPNGPYARRIRSLLAQAEAPKP
jgi:hypothetical protein